MLPGVPRNRVHAVQAAFLKTLQHPELVTEAEKARMTLNPISRTMLQNMIVDGLSMAALAKLKPILAPKA
jgi:hypothetical protein